MPATAATDGLSPLEQHPLLSSGEDRLRRRGDRSLLGRWERGSHYVLPSLPTPPNLFTLAAVRSGMRCDDPRLGGGMLFDAPRAACGATKSSLLLFYSDPPMRQIKTRTAPRRSWSWIIPSRAPSQPRSMSRWRRIVFRHPGAAAAAAAGRHRRESRSPRRRLFLDR